ncbi:MAG: hypothetical protein KAT68_17355 [Bacteroidales bacterium]|nr:hypothetical protein [Bacteroidales bacterium]
MVEIPIFLQSITAVVIVVLGWFANSKYLKVILINRIDKLQEAVSENTLTTLKIGSVTELHKRLEITYCNAIRHSPNERISKVFTYGYERLPLFAEKILTIGFDNLKSKEVCSMVQYSISEAKKKTIELLKEDGIDFVAKHWEQSHQIPGKKLKNEILHIIKDSFNNKEIKFKRAIVVFMEETTANFCKEWTKYKVEKTFQCSLIL